MSRLLIPNTCQVPNVLLDEVMPKLKPAAFKVLLTVVRLTYGWGVASKEIGLSEIQKKTGLSREGVIQGIKDLGGLVTVKRGAKRHPNEYSLNLDMSTGQLVHRVDQSNKLTSPLSGKKVVHRVDPLKPNKRNQERVPKSHSPKNSDPRIKEFFAWWDIEYQRRIGEPYVINGGKEGSLLKNLLRTVDLPKVKKTALCFLDSTDSWVRQNGGFTIGVFTSQFNKIVSTAKATSGQPQRKEMLA